jgi:hypothetical protein
MNVEPQAPPPPDITRDRICLITGSVIVLQHGVFAEPSDAMPCWITLVPRDRSGELPGNYPREWNVRISHVMQIGTVAELVAQFERNMIRCFEALSCKKEDGSWGVIPSLREASLRKQTELLDRVHPVREVDGPFKIDPKILKMRQQERDRIDGYESALDPSDRDVLMRLVGEWGDRRTGGGDGYGPTDEAKCVQGLIDALVQLRDDRRARVASRSALPSPDVVLEEKE